MNPTQRPEKISWQAYEHTNHTQKSGDWFWILGIVAVAGIILCFYFGNILFGIIITIFAITSGMLVNKKPEIHIFELSRKGVRAGNVLYPYSNLESFWVEDTEFEDKILLRSNKSLQPIIVIPFDSTKTDPEILRNYLLDYLDEEELFEGFWQKLMEAFGF